jgi:hypothetical protein
VDELGCWHDDVDWTSDCLSDEQSAAEGEIKEAGKAAGENGIAVECFQALADDAGMLVAVHARVHP